MRSIDPSGYLRPTEAVEIVGGVDRVVGRAAKRAIDVAVAGTGLCLLAPFFLVIAALIRLDSRGMALFVQERVGLDGKPFRFYKFRTMRQDCDHKLHREHVTKLILGLAGEERRSPDGSFKLEVDPRVTRIGTILRRTSIDELPQLLNVLKGEMSLVGPRPPLPYEVEAYRARHMRRLEVLPGITGLWQVSGRTRLSFEEMVDLDLTYIDTWSPWLDVMILLRTVPAVLGQGGAG